MANSTTATVDVERAKAVWNRYREQHDVSGLIGKTAGIEPVSERVWFGESAADVRRQMLAEGIDAGVYCIRVGSDYYLRKGGHR